MALEGTLKDFALPDILQLIGLQKKTGTLVLKNDDEEVAISFKEGQLVSADSSKKRLEDRLGTMLVRGGIITDEQLQTTLERQKQTLQRIGVLLVNNGLVRQDVMRRILEIQVTQIIYRVFRWQDAYYRFDQEDEIDYDHENFVPMGAESVLMEGMRILDEWPIVEKTIRSMQAVYEKADVNHPVEVEGAEADLSDDDFDFDLGGGGGGDSGDSSEKIKLTGDEGTVYELLDGERSVEDVMYLARMGEFDTCKALYDLLERDLIRERADESAAAEADASDVTEVRERAELSPVVIHAGQLLILVIAITGAFLWQRNPLVASSSLAGVSGEGRERQAVESLESRLDRAAQAVESYRLAQGGDRYPGGLDDLLDLGYLRQIDVVTPWGAQFEYTVLDEGKSFRLQVSSSPDSQEADLVREGGRLARRRR